MRSWFRALAFALFFVVLGSAQAAHTKASLLLDSDSARPGETITAGIRLVMEPGWHTYWENSGASGMPTTIDWELPPGISAGTVQWPVPEKLLEDPITTYIYKKEAVLLVPLTIKPGTSPGPIKIKAKVSWLECEVQCIPGSADVEAGFTIGNERKSSAQAGLLESSQKRLPTPGDRLGARAWWEGPPKGDSRFLLIQWSASGATSPDFFPYASNDFEVLGATKELPESNGKLLIRKEIKKSAGDWPTKLSGLLVQTSTAQREAFTVTLPIVASPAVAQSPAAVSAGSGASLLRMLLYALIGGMILNIMPCVLPVIALKILGFVKQANDDKSRIRKLGLIYSLGILVSFSVLAGLVIGLKAAGYQAGWGMQFGNPQFLVLLTILITLVALNLFGLFEITPGARVMGAAGRLAGKHGAAGAFFNGVLATVLATPCTAPFLGAALGFAFAQRAPIIVLMFLTVGLGLALPYLLLSWEPRWLKFLPKPGPWMERFKIVMGFPMLATAVWLFSLLPVYYGERSWWLALFLVVVGLAAWAYGEFVQRGNRLRGLGAAAVLALLAIGFVTIVEGRLRWRMPEAASATASEAGSLREPGGVPWLAWSPQAVEAGQKAGRPVLVDFTAKWCLTCNTVVKPALESGSVRRKIAELNALPLLGDYTRFPADIGEELKRHGRAGVPLVLVFPRDPAKEAIVLPEAITPGMVVDALERAVQ